MRITRTELQEYFAEPLPEPAVLADAFTFHAFEIDSVEGDRLDIKILPNRAADCSTAAGVAAELAAILNMPMKDAAALEYVGQPTVSLTVALIDALLGVNFSREEILDVFRRLQFKVETEGDTLKVTAPKPRADINIVEDVVEEVGQILGYDRVPATELPPLATAPDQMRFRGIERMKDELVAQGFVELSTQSFAVEGAVELANPMDKTHPYLRTSLEANLTDALVSAKHYALRVLAPGQKPKLFEVGSVFPQAGEFLELRMSEAVKEWGGMISDNLSTAKLEEYGKEYEPVRYEIGTYKPFSIYPFMTRDIAFWAPAYVEIAAVEKLLREHAGALLVRLDQFDRFEKEGRVSYGFRFVFESPDRTLTDHEVNSIMDTISASLKGMGYQVR